LSANAHSFDGLATFLSNRLIAVDLRGRGQSDKPDTGYSLDEHAQDILGLLDDLGLEQVMLGGHSYGGLLTLYMAATYPERVQKCVIIDSGLMAPNVRQLIQPSLDRLGQVQPSWQVYRDAIKDAPYWQGYWDEHVEAYYRADVQTNDDGTVQARSRPEAIAEAAEKGLQVDWPALLAQVQQPVLMLHAPGSYGPPGAPAIVPLAKAQETLALLPNHTYVQIPGNHMTMLFGDNAQRMAEAIRVFLHS
jgi:pimeloyl-ACP methyl ester carboxylesterase